MDDERSAPEAIEVLWRKRFRDTLDQVNVATLRVQEVLDDYRSRAIPSPNGDPALRQALRAESEARVEFMRVAEIMQDLLLHGKIPTDDDLQGKD
jgi:hypothetical protein